MSLWRGQVKSDTHFFFFFFHNLRKKKKPDLPAMTTASWGWVGGSCAVCWRSRLCAHVSRTTRPLRPPPVRTQQPLCGPCPPPSPSPDPLVSPPASGAPVLLRSSSVFSPPRSHHRNSHCCCSHPCSLSSFSTFQAKQTLLTPQTNPNSRKWLKHVWSLWYPKLNWGVVTVTCWNVSSKTTWFLREARRSARRSLVAASDDVTRKYQHHHVLATCHPRVTPGLLFLEFFATKPSKFCHEWYNCAMQIISSAFQKKQSWEHIFLSLFWATSESRFWITWDLRSTVIHIYFHLCKRWGGGGQKINIDIKIYKEKDHWRKESELFPEYIKRKSCFSLGHVHKMNRPRLDSFFLWKINRYLHRSKTCANKKLQCASGFSCIHLFTSDKHQLQDDPLIPGPRSALSGQMQGDKCKKCAVCPICWPQKTAQLWQFSVDLQQKGHMFFCSFQWKTEFLILEATKKCAKCRIGARTEEPLIPGTWA